MKNKSKSRKSQESQSNTLNVSGRPRLRRRLFGINTRDVWAALDDREEELGKIRQRADSAQSEAATLRDHLSSLEAKLEHNEQELLALQGDEDIESANDGGTAARFCACPPSDDLLEDMTRVVQMTEESTQRILQHARDTLMKEIEAAGALRQQAKSEIAEAGSWRRHWAPILRAFQATVKETGAAIEEIPERVRDALAPLTAAAAALDEDLRQFAAFEVTMSTQPDADDEAHTKNGPEGGRPMEGEEPSPEAPIVVDEARDMPSPSPEKPVVITDEADPDPATASVTP